MSARVEGTAGRVEGISKEDLKQLERIAFTVETVAHLKGMERQLLPSADWLREFIKRFKE